MEPCARGRLGAVEGQPAATINDHGAPLGCRSAASEHGLFEDSSTLLNFLRNKKQEWEEYRSEVTAFELRKNLPVL